ncbi:MAG: RsmD family RNA methyltransferase [Sandaracinus sp.]|nr:RsmD family RNA methyltransferase [Sandaracinus sp.]
MGSFRIVGGSLRGRRFRPHVGEATRPTSDRVREALTSALLSRGRIVGERVLELFAGTGALSFEAISRGATHAVVVERDRKALAGLKQSIADLGLDAKVTVRPYDLEREGQVARLAADGPFDLVIADPPYAKASVVDGLVRALDAAGALASESLFVVEHALASPPALPSLAPVARYEYGDTAVVFATPVLSSPSTT